MLQQSRLVLALYDKTLLREGVKKITVFLGLCPKLWVGGGPNAPNSLKSKINLTFFSLSGVLNMRGV